MVTPDVGVNVVVTPDDNGPRARCCNPGLWTRATPGFEMVDTWQALVPLDAFRHYLNQQYGTDFMPTGYWNLHAWVILSAENINSFWTALWDFSGFIGEKGSIPVKNLWGWWYLRDNEFTLAFSLFRANQLFDAWSPMSKTRHRFWNTRLNFAENMLLAHPHARSPSQVAVISLVEGQQLATARGRIATSFHRETELRRFVHRGRTSCKRLGEARPVCGGSNGSHHCQQCGYVVVMAPVSRTSEASDSDERFCGTRYRLPPNP
jgi:hypothetical protein